MKPTTARHVRLAAIWIVLAALAVPPLAPSAPTTAQEAAPPQVEPALPQKARVWAGDEVAAGRYLVMISGCNDCHTEGWMMPGGEKTPEEKWLMGSSLGFRGPWGTTYGSNLRLFAKDYDPETFVQVIRARSARPPMPWFSLHSMSDQDLKAILAYLKSLEPLGQPAPAYVPPSQEPKTPYLSFNPVLPQGVVPPSPDDDHHDRERQRH